MNPLLHWLTSPEWTHIVGALLHSLWQGAIIALALALLMRRLANPVTRYRCALVTLGLVVMASIVTWAVLNAPKPAVSTAITIPITEPAITPVATTALNLNSGDKIVALVRMSPPPAPKYWIAWLAVVWMLGAGAMLLRAGIKVAGAENLRRSCRPLNDDRMIALVAEARRAVGLVRQIRVAVTEKLTSPAVVGVLVPTLILPLSLFTTLTPEQIRFVLLHELAHIRRGDYFANLFQLLAEALLFFNPAVWWISHQIRREREASCDALAIELSGAPADYARTLVRVAENILQPATNAALAFGDGQREPSSLTDRVQRLLVPGYRPALRLTWRAMLASLIVGGTLLVLSAVGTRSTVGAILSPREKAASEPLISSPVANFGSNGTTTPVSATFNGIMTDPQFREVVKAIDQRSGINSSNQDQVTQVSGHPAQILISAVDKNNIATEIENQPGHSGTAETTKDSITSQATNNNTTSSIQQPTNVAALNDSRRAMLAVADAWERPTQGGKLPVPNPNNGTNLIWTSKGRQNIIRKLHTIKFDTVAFDGLPLSEVIRTLNDEARKRDPEKSGINFIINPNAPAATGAPVAIDPATGLAVAAAPTEAVDVGAISIKLNPPLIDVRLGDVLKAVERMAEKPLRFSIEDYAVVVSLKGQEVTPLAMRTFNVDPNTFMQGLHAVSGTAFGDVQTGSSGQGGGGGIAGLTTTNATQSVSAVVQKFFTTMGVDLTTPPKSVFWNDRKGQLLVYATMEDLDKIEQAIQVLNVARPQVNIKVKWVEIPPWLVSSMLQEFLTNTVSPSISRTQNIFGILTEKQMAKVRERVDTRDGMDLLSEGDVTTLSQRQCSIQTIKMKTIVTGINPQALIPPGVNSTTNVLERQTTPFGQTLNVIPTVSPEEAKLSLHVIAYANEFLGYGKTKSNVPVYVNGKKKAEVPPLPRYQTHQITNDFVMREGQTLMLGNLPTTEIVKQPNGEFLTTDVTGNNTNFLFVFVTPTIVDPAGNRVNPVEESLQSSPPTSK